MNAAPSLSSTPRPLHHRLMQKDAAAHTEELVDLLLAVGQRRDRAAFACLFAHLAPRLKTFFLRSGASAAAAEDMVQDVMLIVWNKAALYDPVRAGVHAWLFTIARNLRIDAARRDKRTAAMQDVTDEKSPDPLPDRILSDHDDAARIRTALKTLPQEQEGVVRLAFFRDMTHVEIARDLDLPLGTVKSRLRLAMGRLRVLLAETP